jgi:[ribosomal protein S5]-alanine N-acetyltransferase
LQPEWVAADVLLRLVHEADAGPLARAHARNREHLRRWEPPRPPEFFTPEGQAERLREHLAAQRTGQLVPWVLVRGDDVVGTVALSNMAVGPFRSASLGYWIDAELTGRGLATAAVDRVCQIADRELDLHRLEAGTRTDNTASQRVLRKCGFERIGVAPGYLYIDGAWRDHLLFQRVLNDRSPGTGGP